MRDCVHVYGVRLDVDDEARERLQAWLAPDEAARGRRFLFDVHRRRFAVARCALRGVLAHQLGAEPGALSFAYGDRGKPSLNGQWHGALHFNLSHSQDRALIAVSRAHELGVDVEAVRESIDHAAIARRFFAPREVEALLAVPGPARASAFFEVWTRKEAYLKLGGGGLGVPLHSFDVSLGEPPRLLRDDRDPAAPARVTLATPAPAAGFKAAVAVNGPSEVRAYELTAGDILKAAVPVL